MSSREVIFSFYLVLKGITYGVLYSIRHYISGEKIVKVEHIQRRAIRMNKKLKIMVPEN